jgi:hypothetical protein
MRPATRCSLAVIVLAAACRGGPVATAPAPAAAAVAALVDTVATSGLWPGFDPRTVPLAIYDGQHTWLFRHPSPPDEYVPAPGYAGARVRAGRDTNVWANTNTVLGGVATATLMPGAAGQSVRQRAAVAVHESFHVYQRQHHPRWIANEGELFTYPVADTLLLTLRRLESEALRRAVDARHEEGAACWARTAMAERHERFARMPAGARDYERFNELNEGLASYVQQRVAGFDAEAMPRAEFPAEAVRQRFYASGPALARLLDRLLPAWRERLERSDSTFLDALLDSALVADSGAACALKPEDRLAIARTAATDVAALRARRSEQERAFLAQPGWRIVVLAAAGPLWPQGFDPLNVQPLDGGEVLHTRFVRLGNDAGNIEVLGHATLTAPAGAHPLFNGVRTLTITGLGAEPAVRDSAGAIRLEADGIHAAFRGASVSRSGQVVEVRLAR